MIDRCKAIMFPYCQEMESIETLHCIAVDLQKMKVELLYWGRLFEDLAADVVVYRLDHPSQKEPMWKEIFVERWGKTRWLGRWVQSLRGQVLYQATFIGTARTPTILSLLLNHIDQRLQRKRECGTLAYSRVNSEAKERSRHMMKNPWCRPKIIMEILNASQSLKSRQCPMTRSRLMTVWSIRKFVSPHPYPRQLKKKIMDCRAKSILMVNHHRRLDPQLPLLPRWNKIWKSIGNHPSKEVTSSLSNILVRNQRDSLIEGLSVLILTHVLLCHAMLPYISNTLILQCQFYLSLRGWIWPALHITHSYLGQGLFSQPSMTKLLSQTLSNDLRLFNSIVQTQRHQIEVTKKLHEASRKDNINQVKDFIMKYPSCTRWTCTDSSIGNVAIHEGEYFQYLINHIKIN